MVNRTALRLAALACLFVLFGVVGAVSPVSAQSCDTVTDAHIVAEVYSRLKADKGLASQINHINVVAVNAAVKLQGWVESRKDFDKVVDIVSTVRCVRVINVNAFEAEPPPGQNRGGAGCGSGMKQCGDICIPVSDTCAIGVEGD